MKSARLLAWGSLTLALGLAAPPVLADDDCDAPVQQWQSRDAAMQMAAQQGWQVRRLKIDDGCYEMRGLDAQGRAFKAKIDPRTLAVVEMKQRDRGDGPERERRRERQRQADQPASGAASGDALTPPPGGSRGRIE